MLNPLVQFFALCWKDDAALFFPNGSTRPLSCNHVIEGNYGVNIRGEAFPIPTSTNVPLTSPPAASPPNQFEAQNAMVLAGEQFGPITPFYTGNPNYKLCVKIKDLKTGICTYVDATSYAANVVKCNPVS